MPLPDVTEFCIYGIVVIYFVDVGTKLGCMVVFVIYLPVINCSEEHSYNGRKILEHFFENSQ